MPTQTERKRLKQEYGDPFQKVTAALFMDDPVGLNFEDNTDEYDTEAATILPRLRSCRSALDVRNVVHQEFCRWFDASTAGPIERYTNVSETIWNLWHEHTIG